MIPYCFSLSIHQVEIAVTLQTVFSKYCIYLKLLCASFHFTIQLTYKTSNHQTFVCFVSVFLSKKMAYRLNFKIQKYFMEIFFFAYPRVKSIFLWNTNLSSTIEGKLFSMEYTVSNYSTKVKISICYTLVLDTYTAHLILTWF